MNNEQFIESLKSKTIKALLGLLRNGQNDESKIDPEYLSYIIDELNSRKLSEKEIKVFENLIGISFDNIPVEKADSDSKISDKEIKEIQKDTKIEQSKYSALKIMVGLISIPGYIVIVTGIVLLVLSLTNEQTTTGILSLLISIVIALLLLSFANLIHVFIDIEYNTRKTRYILDKKFK